MALANMGFKDQKLVSFWRGGNRRERERGEQKERKRGRGRRWRSQASQGMESNLGYGTWYRIVWIHVCGLWVVRNLTLK